MMQTHKTLSKVLVVCLTLVMMVSMFVANTSAIDDTDKGTITVSGVEDDVTVSAYRLMDVTYDYTADQPVQPVYTWTNAVAGWVRENNPTYIGAENDNSVQPAFSTAQTDAIAAFYDALAAAIKSGELTVHSVDRTGSGDIENLPMGNYLILIENGMRVYRPSAANLIPEWNAESEVWEITSPAQVEVKSSELTIEKTVRAPGTETGKESDNANIGDTITYDILVDVPQFPTNALVKNYAVSDILPAGLTRTEDPILVYGVKSGEPESPLIQNTHYTQGTTRPSSGSISTFTLTFDYTQIQTYEKIHIQYTATLNGSAELGETGNVNTAYLDYSNNPYTEESWKSQDDSATIYTYGLNIDKVDGDDNAVFLAGAEFSLYTSQENAEGKNSPVLFIRESEGVYRKALENEEGTAALTVGSGENGSTKGNLVLKGLDETTWYLVENRAPDGYNLLNAPVSITITDTKENTLDGKVTDADIVTGLVPLTVENDDGFQLPVTGGMGTVLFTAAGVVLMGAGAVLFFILRKKKKTER